VLMLAVMMANLDDHTCNNSDTNCHKLGNLLKCQTEKRQRKLCQLSCGQCIPGIGMLDTSLISPASIRKQAMSSFLTRCYSQNQETAAKNTLMRHRIRWQMTARLAAPYLLKEQNNPRILHVGDGPGMMSMLLHRFFGFTRQETIDLPSSCLLARYYDGYHLPNGQQGP